MSLCNVYTPVLEYFYSIVLNKLGTNAPSYEEFTKYVERNTSSEYKNPRFLKKQNPFMFNQIYWPQNTKTYFDESVETQVLAVETILRTKCQEYGLYLLDRHVSSFPYNFVETSYVPEYNESESEYSDPLDDPEYWIDP